MPNLPTLALYYTPGACSLASHIALEEAGVAFESKCVVLHDESARAEYLRVNPSGRVPALLVDGALLTETIAILSFVSTLAPRLMPDDPWTRVLCLSRMAWFASSAHIAFRQTRRPERFANTPEAFPAVRDAGHAAFRAALTEIDAMLRDVPWVGGHQFSVADGYALVFYGWGLSNAYDMSAYRHFDEFRRRCVSRPALRRALDRENSIILTVPR
jgi:glutathione S-transferase